jgi:replication-associated recombination protein RarA
LVSRIQQLDRLSAALRENTAPLVPGLTASNLHEQLDVVEQTLDQEEQMLAVLSQSMKLLVDSTTGEMRHTMRLLEVDAQIPDDQILQLSQTRAAVQTVLDEVTQAHGRAADSALEMLSQGTPPAIADQDELLRKVDQMLNASR